MKFDQELQPAYLVRRYKRFLADVAFADGSTATVHCPNSGSMLGCDFPGIEIRLSRAQNKKRKYPLTLEMVNVEGVWIGINTSRTNFLVREAMENGVIKELCGFDLIRPEVKVGNSRLDFLLDRQGELTYLEVKNCTLAEDNTALFPDAVTVRGTKHLLALADLVRHGHGAAVLFCVQRLDAEKFSPAAHIDSVYASTLRAVSQEGVMVLAYQADVQPTGIRVFRKLPVEL